MKRLLVIEDGAEYDEFARVFLAAAFEIAVARSAREAIELLRAVDVTALLMDLRFDRAAPETLVGDIAATATRLFGGDQTRATRYLQDQQGTLILGAIRAAGFQQPAVFVHDFPQRRLDNLKRLYGAVAAVPCFDAAGILAALAVGA